MAARDMKAGQAGCAHTDRGACLSSVAPPVQHSFNPVPNAEAERRLLAGIMEMYSSQVLPQALDFVTQDQVRPTQPQQCGPPQPAHCPHWVVGAHWEVGALGGGGLLRLLAPAAFGVLHRAPQPSLCSSGLPAWLAHALSGLDHMA